MIKLAGFQPDIDIKIKIVGLRPVWEIIWRIIKWYFKTKPTYHEKIMIAEIIEEYVNLHYDIDKLLLSAVQ
jgi:FlaA1/EpsC-like NDP-sugar epimerase